jgi:hypothetical protein
MNMNENSNFTLSAIILLLSFGFLGWSCTCAGSLIAPYQINWTQEIDSNVSINGYLFANNTEENASRIDALETNVSIAQGNISVLEGNVTVIEGNITVIEGNISTLEGNITTLEGNITTLETDLDLNSSRIDAANSTHLALVGGTMIGNITMSNKTLLNFSLEHWDAAPNADEGYIYFNTTDDKIYIYHGGWIKTGALT